MKNMYLLNGGFQFMVSISSVLFTVKVKVKMNGISWQNGY